jgi:D-3-phosphoglycerate dehydrogenase
VQQKRVFYVKYLADRCYADILGARPDVVLERLENDTPDAAAAPVLEAAHAYQISSARDEIDGRWHARRPLLARMPNLLLVSTSGAGYDTVDLADCTAAGVLVVNQAGGNREAVAEHVLAMMLGLAKRIAETDHVMRRTAAIERNAFMGSDIRGKTVGIVGLGHVGSRVAELCRGLFAMEVLAYDPYLSAEETARRGARKVALDELLRRADFVSVNCPLTAETRGMFGTAQYALMQRHAFFITTARGHIHDEAALAEALAERRIAGAGLDVWTKEPPPPDHPLLRFDNVLASPHTAGVTREARANIARIAAEQLLDALDGRRPPRILNPEVWPRYAERFGRLLGVAPEGFERAGAAPAA